MTDHVGLDTSYLDATTFRNRCAAFYDLCGGLLKLHNICGPNSDMVKANACLAIETFQKICNDFIGTGEL